MSNLQIENIRSAQQIVDSNGVTWLYEDCRIRVPAADHLVPDNGYPCYSFEDGIELLKAYGYINEPPSSDPTLRAAYDHYRSEIGA